MSRPLRVFISHSSTDKALAQALEQRLQQLPDVEVLLDCSGLEEGQPWRRQLHEWMARCNAAVVLLTQAVLDRPQWVLKEAVILGWRLDVEPGFPVYFVLGPGLDHQRFDACGFNLAQLSETQLLAGQLADPAQVDALLQALQPALLKAQERLRRQPCEDLTEELAALLCFADPDGVTFEGLAGLLGLDPIAWGPERLKLLARAIAQALVKPRDGGPPLDELIQCLSVWSREHREKLLQRVAPLWIAQETAGDLLHCAPLYARAAAPQARGPGAVTIAGQHVSYFTAEMAVRRAFGLRFKDFRLWPVPALQSDLFDDIRAELCQQARSLKWVPPTCRTDEQVVQALRASVAPVFVPLELLPDADTVARLRTEFPRVLFLAPRPPEATAAAVDEIQPAPDPRREQAEYDAWQLARNAIDNG